MSDWKQKNDSRNRAESAPEPSLIARYGKYVPWLLLAVALLYFLSPLLARGFLALSRQANESAYYAALSDVLQGEESFQLPTYTPLPTYTAPPTQTAIAHAHASPDLHAFPHSHRHAYAHEARQQRRRSRQR